MEDLADQQQKIVGVVPRMLVGGLVQNLVGLVGEPRLQILLLQLLVGRYPSLPQGTHPPKALIQLHPSLSIIKPTGV